MTARITSPLPTAKLWQLKKFKTKISYSIAEIPMPLVKIIYRGFLYKKIQNRIFLKSKNELKHIKNLNWHHFSLQDLLGNRKNRNWEIQLLNFATYYSPFR